MLPALSGVVVGYGSRKACGIFAFPLQAEQAQLPQLLLVHHLIQPHLRCLLWTCSNTSVSFHSEEPQLGHGIQMWPHQCQIKGKNIFC